MDKMSKKISYKGIIATGEQQEINLKTNNGKIGYRITKFQIIEQTPGAIDSRSIAKIFKTDQTGSITDTVDFSDSDLLGVAFSKIGNSGSDPVNDIIIFDTEKFNQNIFITVADVGGSTTPINFYLELEAMPINDLEATYMTLQNIRQVLS